MSYIDKIYGNSEQWEQLRDFLSEEYPEALRYMYECPESSFGNEWPLANFSPEVDNWLIKNCNIDFVLDRLKEQYKDYDELKKWK